MSGSRGEGLTAETRDGVKIFYDDVGKEDAADILLFIPGALGFAASDYPQQIEELRKDFRILAMDPRGYGRSRPPRRDFPVDFQRRDASDAVAVVEHALAGRGDRRVSVCGWSDGANEAVLFAALRPDLAKRVVMWGGNAYVTEEDVTLLSRDIDPMPPAYTAILVQMYGADYLRTLGAEWLQSMERIRLDVPDGDVCRAEAAQVSCPVLLLHGDKDDYIPSYHPEFYRRTITAPLQYRSYPEGRHDIHIQFAEDFNAEVRSFCTGAV